MVDIHCHILPETDDGADSWETAIEMCRLAAADGIEHTVASPHANSEFAYDRAHHETTLAQLRERSGGQPQLTLGCDFHLSFENLEDALARPEQYVIGQTHYLLVELNDFMMPRYVGGALARLLDAGITPILTHPERNLMLQRDPTNVLAWAEDGCVVQVTASSVTGLWGQQAANITHWLLQRQALHVLASDAHNVHSRPPAISAARNLLARQYGAALADAVVEQNPRAIVNNLPLPYFPRPLRRR